MVLFPIAPPGICETVLFSRGSRLLATTFSAVSRSRRRALSRDRGYRLLLRSSRAFRKNRNPDSVRKGRSLSDSSIDSRKGVPRLTLTLSILAILALMARDRLRVFAFAVLSSTFLGLCKGKRPSLRAIISLVITN